MGIFSTFFISHVTRMMNVIFKLFRMMMLQCCDASIGNILTAGIIESLRLHYYTQLSTAIMRFTLSALAVVLLQLSSLPSQSDAFSPAAVLSSVVKTSSPPARKNDILYAQLNDDDGEKRLNESSTNKSGMVSSILLAGAALQFSTTKVSARTVYYVMRVPSLNLFTILIIPYTGISRRKRIKCSWNITTQWDN